MPYFVFLINQKRIVIKMGIKRWSGLKALLKLNLLINYILLLAKQ